MGLVKPDAYLGPNEIFQSLSATFWKADLNLSPED